MKSSRRAGKPLILALCVLAVPACDRLPGSRNQLDPSSLQASSTDPQIRAFYEAREWKAAWDGKSEKALLEALDGAKAHGLRRDLFLKGDLPKDAAAREAALTAAALKYASALARGYADPKKLYPVYTLPRPKFDVASDLARTVGSGDLKAWFDGLAPQTDEYRALSAAHLHYLALATKAQAAPIPDGKPIKPGHRDARVIDVARALGAMDMLPLERANPRRPDRYEGALVDAVKHLQADYGLKADGIIGGDTLDALNGDASGRARQLAIAMERLRWLERSPPATRIDVNTAAAVLDYWRGDRLVDHRNVVVGEPDKQTPQIEGAFSQLVANPKWRVPDSIAAKEVATKGAGWLAENNFTVEDGRYVQESGPKNSLGLVKFDVQDPQQIYLHDTPAKALFSLPERHRSHGCVRVQNALQFAAMFAAEDGVLDKFEEALASGEEKWVKLRSATPVRLLYHTAFWDGSKVEFRPDVYGWDDDVARAIGLARGPVRRRTSTGAEDIGP